MLIGDGEAVTHAVEDRAEDLLLLRMEKVSAIGRRCRRGGTFGKQASSCAMRRETIDLDQEVGVAHASVRLWSKPPGLEAHGNSARFPPAEVCVDAKPAPARRKKMEPPWKDGG
jgi:hypothetical protein